MVVFVARPTARAFLYDDFHGAIKFRLPVLGGVAAVGNDEFQPIHLEQVPPDDIGDVHHRFHRRHLAELILVVVDKSVEHGLTRQQKVVALPLKPIGALIGFLGIGEKLRRGHGIFAHHAQFAVDDAATVVQHGEVFARRSVVAIAKIRTLATGDFQAVVAHIVFPRLVLDIGKHNLALRLFPSVVLRILDIESMWTAKPRLVDEVELGVAYP